MIKSLMRQYLPDSAIRLYRSIRRSAQERLYGGDDSSAVFTAIYSKRLWGGTAEDPSSGTGTRADQVTAPYIAMVAKELSELRSGHLTVVDLGCGDFVVGRKMLPFCDRYVGVDVVESLIDAHRRSVHETKAEFVRLDICKESLPDGDVCFVRQVFQHLSNDQIQAILPKLGKYRRVYVTEHQPTDMSGAIPNVDKECGPGIRLYRNSGVVLDAPPFDIPSGQIAQVLEISAGPSTDEDEGVIRTFRIPGEAFRPGGPAP